MHNSWHIVVIQCELSDYTSRNVVRVQEMEHAVNVLEHCDFAPHVWL